MPEAKTKIWFKWYGKVHSRYGQSGVEENKKNSEVIGVAVHLVIANTSASSWHQSVSSLRTLPAWLMAAYKLLPQNYAYELNKGQDLYHSCESEQHI